MAPEDKPIYNEIDTESAELEDQDARDEISDADLDKVTGLGGRGSTDFG